MATLIIGLLALAAALVTILAAVAEVRQVFPKQRVRISTIRREYLDQAYIGQISEPTDEGGPDDHLKIPPVMPTS